MRFKILVIITTTLVLLVALTAKVIAAETNFGKSFTEIRFDENGNGQVKHNVQINNTSTQKVIDSLNFELPFPFENLAVTLGGVPVAPQINGNFVVINLQNNPIKLNTQTTMDISYTMPRRFQNSSAIKNIFIPKINITLGMNDNGLRIYLPKSVGNLVYVSRVAEISKEEGNQYVLEFKNYDQVYLSLSKYEAIGLHAVFKVLNDQNGEIKVRLPMPGKDYNPVVFADIQNFKEGLRDSNANEFMLLQVAAKTAESGSFKGILAKHDYQFLVDKSLSSIYFAGVGSIKDQAGANKEAMYQYVLDKLHPAFPDSNWQRRSVEDLLKADKHDSLDYANLLTGLYRQQGVPAQIAYGLVHLPSSDRFVWHFWVVFQEDEVWREQDPFLQDLLEFDFANNVTPDRLIWGILPDDDNASTLGLMYLANPADAMEFIQDAKDALELKSDYKISLENIDQAYSAHSLNLHLFLQNFGNHNLYLDKVQIENVILEEKSVRSFLLLPETNEVLKIPGVLIGNPFYQGQAEIAGSIAVKYADKLETSAVATSVDLEVDYTFIVISILVLLAVLIILFRYVKHVLRKIRH